MPVVLEPSVYRMCLLPECYAFICLHGSLGTPQYVLTKPKAKRDNSLAKCVLQTNRSAWGLPTWSEGQTTQGIYNGGVLSGPLTVLSHLKAALEND
ncbi:hypothetical transcript [Echinococcus multilocularis]|uniref:Hypothetical transcript n=1 Tax=Echinococcus multilocularis TaxID=6211 RepID=A0A068XV37_ECHMU|nr:hypothetical transcript [Echinococcus multilocularis]